MFFMPSIDVNGLEPWMSQVISSNTVRNVLIVTNRTPASIKSPGEQAALAEAIHAVASRGRLRLLGQIERIAGLRAGHQAISGLEIVVHQLARSRWLRSL